jgi:hypothetical protein
MKKIRFITVLFMMMSIALQLHAAERFTVNYREEIDLGKKALVSEVGRYVVKADMTRPAKPFKELIFRFHIERNGEPVELKEGYVKFNMVMDMGLYKAKLQKAATGYTAKIVLPKCIFRGKRWFAKLVFEEGSFNTEKIYLFDMKE